MKAAVTNVILLLLFSTISAQYQGESPKESFYKQNPSLNEWNSTGQAGAVIGFGVFGIMYLYAIVMIFRDIRQNDAKYSELLKDDEQTMRDMGMNKDSDEMKEQLKNRLAGKQGESGTDDQLLFEAAKVPKEVYQQYL